MKKILYLKIIYSFKKSFLIFIKEKFNYSIKIYKFLNKVILILKKYYF
jgi:hypothetical protein